MSTFIATPATTNVLDEIDRWSEKLLDWQSDALRRIVLNRDLAPSDIEDVTALCKAEHGLPEADAPKAIRRSDKVAPTRSLAGAAVT